MSEQTNTGGPAFPWEQRQHPSGEWNTEFGHGMTLRDYFAAKAMQSALTGMLTRNGVNDHCKPSDLAQWAYECADAMLAEKFKGENGQ